MCKLNYHTSSPKSYIITDSMYENYCFFPYTHCNSSEYKNIALLPQHFSCMTPVPVSRLTIAQRMAPLMQDQTMNSPRALWSLNRVRL